MKNGHNSGLTKKQRCYCEPMKELFKNKKQKYSQFENKTHLFIFKKNMKQVGHNSGPTPKKTKNRKSKTWHNSELTNYATDPESFGKNFTQ